MANADIMDEGAFYRKKLLLSIFIPAMLLVLMWLVRIIEVLFDLNLTGFGIYPLTAKGVPGNIIFSLHPFGFQASVQQFNPAIFPCDSAILFLF